MCFTKQLLSVTILLVTWHTSLFGLQGVRYSVVDGDKSKLFDKMINEKLRSINFVLLEPLTRVNELYKEDFGSTDLDNLGFAPVSNDQLMLPLLLKVPELGAFTPFNLHIFKRTSQDQTYIGHLTPDTMLDIAGVKDQQIRKEFSSQFGGLDLLVDKEMNGTIEYVEYSQLPASPLLQFSFSLKELEAPERYLEAFQEKLETLLDERGYIVTGYRDIKALAGERGVAFNRYGAYRIYSFCHIAFSEAVFNHGRPDAGVFAPCSMYIYNIEGSDTVIVGLPAIENWISVMGINDNEMINMARYRDNEIIEIMKSLGGIHFE